MRAEAGNAQVDLDWEGSSDRGSAITGYQYRKKGRSENWGSTHTWVDIPDSAPPSGNNKISYSITTGLTNGTEYSFQVRAKNGEGESDPSNSIDAMPRLPKPFAPVLSGNYGNAEVTLSWTTPDDGGSDITGYQYQQKEGSGSWSNNLSIPNSASATDYIVPNLRNGTTYSFQVKAVNIHGESEASNPIELIPVTRPAAPYDFEAEGGDAQVELAWTVPDNGGDAIIRHQYQQSEDSQGFGQWQDIPDSAETGTHKNNYIVTSLANGTLYNFQVRAVNTKEGGGDVSDPKSARPEVPATSPSPPRELEFDAGNGQVTLKWKPSLSDGGRSIKEHQYRKRISGGNWPNNWTTIPSSAPGKSHATVYVVLPLSNGTTYEFEVRVLNTSDLASASSNLISAIPEAPDTEPDSPTNLNVTDEGNAYVVLAWTASVSDGGSPITKHQYQQKVGTGNGNWGVWNDIPDSAPSNGNNKISYKVTGLGNGTLYTFQVRAISDVGDSPASNPATGTPEVKAPDAPTQLTASPEDAEVTLNWQASVNDGGSPITKHQYRKKEANEIWGTSHTWTDIPSSAPGEGNATRFTITTGLSNGTFYTFEVRVVNSSNLYSDAVEIDDITPGSTATKPGIPTLRVNVRNGALLLDWTAPSSDGGSDITGYQYQKKTEDDSWTDQGVTWEDIPNSEPGETHASSYLLGNLDNGTEYNVRIRAINDEGEGDPSNHITEIPLGPPTAPTGLLVSVDPNESGEITFYWTPPASDGGSSITGYQYKKKEGSGGSWSGWTNIPDGEWVFTDSGNQIYFDFASTDGITYTFKFRAENDVDVGPASDEISGMSVGPPDSPIQFVADPGNGQVTLEWVNPVNTGGLPIIKYKYLWSKNGGADSINWTDIPDSGQGGDNDTSYTVGNLENGSLYIFIIQVFTREGSNPLAAASSPTPDVKPIGPPSAPRNPRFTVGDGQLTLRWQTPSSDGGSAITRHEYKTKVGSSGTWPSTWTAIPNSAHDGANARSFIVTPLDNGTEYTFKIRAVNDVDAGASVTTASATPEPATTVPEAPTNLKAIPSDAKFFLSWEPPVNNGGEIITKYRRQKKIGNQSWGNWFDIFNSGVGEANEMDFIPSTSINNGTTYHFRLRAVNSNGESGNSMAVEVTPNRPSSFRQKITGGVEHSCALEDDDQAGGSGVLCWGNNDSEQLGLGDDLADEIISMQPYLLLAKESHRGVRL